MRQILKAMFDTVAGKFEKGPYFPKDESRNSWETRTREFFDAKLGTRQTATGHVFIRPEARIAIFGDGGILRLEASLPKLLHGSNLMSGVVRTPDVLTDEEASTMPIAALTAWFALAENGRLEAKQWVGIEGTGGVSLFGFQIAKALGARTVVISGSEDKLKRVLELGADAVVLRTPGKPWDEEVLGATAGEGVDHFLATAGGKSIQQAINVLRMGGHIAQIGFLEDKQLAFSATSLMMRQGRLWGVTVGHRRAFERMLSAFEQHGIHPVIDRTYSFAETPDAFLHLKRGAFGKIVVTF
jgi:NADPH:quinone reductase-like Zn-dependent oxidoreductase